MQKVRPLLLAQRSNLPLKPVQESQSQTCLLCSMKIKTPVSLSLFIGPQTLLFLIFWSNYTLYIVTLPFLTKNIQICRLLLWSYYKSFVIPSCDGKCNLCLNHLKFSWPCPQARVVRERLWLEENLVWNSGKNRSTSRGTRISIVFIYKFTKPDSTLFFRWNDIQKNHVQVTRTTNEAWSGRLITLPRHLHSWKKKLVCFTTWPVSPRYSQRMHISFLACHNRRPSQRAKRAAWVAIPAIDKTRELASAYVTITPTLKQASPIPFNPKPCLNLCNFQSSDEKS
jgi:hypothetical protein